MMRVKSVYLLMYRKVTDPRKNRVRIWQMKSQFVLGVVQKVRSRVL